MMEMLGDDKTLPRDGISRRKLKPAESQKRRNKRRDEDSLMNSNSDEEENETRKGYANKMARENAILIF